MTDPDPVWLETFAALRERLEEDTLGVDWVVRSDIGPGWIGGGREFDFAFEKSGTLDRACPVHARLAQALVEALQLPESFGDEMMTGEGEFELSASQLKLRYEFTPAVPYEHGRSEGGLTTLLDFDAEN